jgi:hypothetical protein
MRIRQVKQGFWTDKVMARLPKCTRLIYIGLWMLADDAGWIESFDVEQAAAELFPFDSAHRRERDLAADVERLIVAGRVVRHDCGCLVVPHLSEHQRIAGRQNFGAREAHMRSHSAPRSDVALPVATRSPGTVGNGRERNGTVDAREAQEPTEFQERVGSIGDILAVR